MIVMGFAPQPFLKTSEPATTFLLETIEQKRLTAIEAAEQDTPSIAVFDREEMKWSVISYQLSGKDKKIKTDN
jgi:hypothetical protein